MWWDDMVPTTLDALMEVLAWSLNVLASGEAPTLDYKSRPTGAEGGPLAGGWRGVLAVAPILHEFPSLLL